MASVAPGAPPHPTYQLPHQQPQQDDDLANDDNLWAMVANTASSAGPSSVGFFPSPASGSLASSWAFVDANGQIQPSPPALSPLDLDLEVPAQPHAFALAPYADGMAFDELAAAVGVGGQYMPPGCGAETVQGQDFSFVIDDPLAPPADFSSVFDTFSAFSALDAVPPVSSPELDFGQEQSQACHSDGNMSPWTSASTSIKAGESPIFVIEDPSFTSPSPPVQYTPSPSPPTSAHGISPIQIKRESLSGPGLAISPGSAPRHTDQHPSAHKVPPPIAIIRKVRGDVRIQKRKPSAFEPLNTGSSPASSNSSTKSKFLIVTPESVTAHAGKPNPWECFDAMRPSQRGRKGPLATDAKESALQVRRLGACFCCHARKVKCDKERPCRNCTRLTVQVPQVMCWQFQDFLPVLFPDFLRRHFKKEEMARFMRDHVGEFARTPCSLELFSGATFRASLRVEAKFFTPCKKTRHWHLTWGSNQNHLNEHDPVPIGLDMDWSGAHVRRDEVKKKVREYVAAICAEPAFAEQVTDTLRKSSVPRKVLAIVQGYAAKTDHPIVNRALNIYAMQYIMTKHLCLTRTTINSLRSSMLVPTHSPWVTSRVLNRQIKSLLDEMLMREIQLLFESFSKSLKPKIRKEWAPCLAAFLVLCMFMESVETAADGFVVSQIEIDERAGRPSKWPRTFALGLNREVEALPFQQFAYQFHQIYQTHTRDVSARSFNPLVDENFFSQCELDPPAVTMVWELRKFLHERSSWDELDFLVEDKGVFEVNPHQTFAQCPFAHQYTGRLLSRFLLSFLDERYIFGLE